MTPVTARAQILSTLRALRGHPNFVGTRDTDLPGYALECAQEGDYDWVFDLVSRGHNYLPQSARDQIYPALEILVDPAEFYRPQD